MRFHKIFIPFFTAFLLLATLGTFSLYAEEDLIKGKPTLTGEAYQIENLTNDWSDQELWVWTKISKGEIADFNKTKGYGGVLDPREPEEWPESRILTPEFLETILLREPFRGTLTRHGVRIIGAWFKDKLDLSDATLAHQLWLVGSRFDKDVNLSFLKTPFLIILDGSKFTRKLNMEALQVESHLSMRTYDTDNEFYEAKYEANFVAEFEEVDLRSAKIEEQLIMNGSILNGELIMDSLYVGNYLLMRDNAEFNYVSLLNAKIDSAIEMDGSKFTGELMMQRVEIENSLFMRNAEFVKVTLDGAKIGGNLELSGSKFNSVDLTDTFIGREFRLSSKKTANMPDIGDAEWNGASKLTLFNTKIGVLQDSQNSWPDNIELDGFTYDRLGMFITDDGNDIAIRDISWLKRWMKKQVKYSPQPYLHLASILRKAGYKGKADSILFASWDRERNNATGLYWYGLYARKHLIGYNYVYRIICSFIWIIIFIAIGAVFTKKNKKGKKMGIDCIFFSLDKLLPIIRLDERNYKINLDGSAKYYFYFHILMGYFLAYLLFDGISGLIQ